MSDDHIKSEIASYLAGGLTESRNRQIEAHAAACEKCRYAIAKARAKQARVKREALKKASSDPMPNLFLARQGKEMGADRPRSNAPWIIVSLLLVGGLGYWAHRLRSSFARTAAPASEMPLVRQSSVTATSPPVAAASVHVLAVVPKTAAIAAASVPLKPPSVVTVQQEWKGSDSGIKDARLLVIRNKEAWEKLWMDMEQSISLPGINFDEHVVFGIFKGSAPPGSFISLGKIREREEEVDAPFRVTFPDVQVSSAAAPTPWHPYFLGLIPRTDKKIRLTQKEAS